MPRHLTTRRPQRGAGVLGVIAMLLLIALVVVLYLNRHLLLAHQSASNQWRAAVAVESAEAGLSWMQDRLNHPGHLDAQCEPATLVAAGTDFRANHLPTSTVPGASAGCRLPGGSLDCACPNNNQTWADDSAARFVVRLAPETGTGTVRAQALGCAPDTAPCDQAAPNQLDTDARAWLSVALRPVPLLPSLPAAALTCAGECRLLEQASLRNDQIVGLGLAAHTATTLTRAPSTQVLGLPGAPPALASVENDPTLATAAGAPCNDEALFAHLFQQSLAAYARSPLTRHLSCPTDNDCSATIRQAHALGWRAFYLPAGALLSSGEAIGSPDAPVALVTPGRLTIDNAPNVYGVLFAHDTFVNASDGGAADIRGATVSCHQHRQGGQSEVAHDADTLNRLRESTRTYERVPGSWRDTP
ncbi:hypothetical protein [Hydrogenophaga atypica]|uniref:Type 4 fimbrial biogenesis protein PilX N-terminal domain-containing protein n=1 Tax=Hydrogenophaga atypica TaxID=249409 RepID=A0ABW2QQU5_9BURK